MSERESFLLMFLRYLIETLIVGECLSPFTIITPFERFYNPRGSRQENQFAKVYGHFIFVPSIDLSLPLMICTGAIKNR